MSIHNESFPALGAAFSSSETVGLTSASASGASVKRLLDLVLALLALGTLLPLLAVIAAAVKLDSSGPIFFHQRRAGRHGKIFHIIKFRSMSVLEDGAQIVQAKTGDTRVTRIGRFLRRSSLDELPQLLNVIAGEMSLVGPRPHALAHDEYYGSRIANYRRRQAVRPGITGWAQVNGARGATPKLSDMQARIDFDIAYVERDSLWLDILILLRTPFEVLRRRNAV
ncbi:MAG TPA: exopolysaccharide biosynthesis polyprenyl glycosylphosphotransferase [Rhizomicrobium sp.]